MLEILQKGLITIDYFGQPVQITLKKQKKFKTIIGGLLSILVFSFIIYLIITNGMNLLNRKQLKTSATSLYQLDSPLLNLTDLQSFFGAYFLTKEFIPFFDPSFFDYEIYQFIVKRDDTGNSTVSFVPLTIKNCSLYYEQFKEKNFEKSFLQNSLFEGVCFDPGEKDLIIGGKFTGNYFSNILFRFNKCKNKTTTNYSNKGKESRKLKDREDFTMNREFNFNEYNNTKELNGNPLNKTKIKLNSKGIEYKNERFLIDNNNSNYDENYAKNDQKNENNLNPVNLDQNSVDAIHLMRNMQFNSPFIPIKTEDAFKSYINKAQTQKDIVCQPNEVIDKKIQGGFFQFYYFDNNIDLNNYQDPFNEYFSRYFILLDPKSQKFVDLYFKSVNITSDAGIIFELPSEKTRLVFDFYREQIDTYSNSEKIIELLINSSNNVMRYTIVFTKFQDFAASIGGLMNILLQVGSLLTLFFNEFQMNQLLINSLFNFDFDKINRSKKIPNMNFGNLNDLNNKENKDANESKHYLASSIMPNFNTSIVKSHLKRTRIDLMKRTQTSNNNNERKVIITEFSKGKRETVNYLNEDQLKNNYIQNEKNDNKDFKTNSDLKNRKYKSNEVELNNNLNPCTSKSINLNQKKLKRNAPKNDFRDLVENPELFDCEVSNIVDDSKVCVNQKIDDLNLYNNNKTSKNFKANTANFESKFNNNLTENELKDHKSKLENALGNENIIKSLLNKLSLLKNKKERKLDYAWYEIIFITFCQFTKKIKEKKKLYLKAKNKLFKYLDFIEIVTCIQEIHKLKKIVFSKEELDLFNFHTKPKLDLDIKKKKDPSKSSIPRVDEQHLLNILFHYKNLKEKSHYDEKTKNLLKLFDEDIKYLYEDILFMGQSEKII